MTELATGAAKVLVLLARELRSRGAAFFFRFVLFSSLHRNSGLGHRARIATGAWSRCAAESCLSRPLFLLFLDRAHSLALWMRVS
jgi:hypothetical protein